MTDKIIYENYSEPALAGFSVNWPRVASRGIVLKGNKMLAFLKQRTGQYKLPGGEKEGDETPEDTFRREVLEETGYTVKNIRKIGITKGFTQVSHVFVAEADEYRGENPDENEVAEDSKPIEIEPEEFLEKCGAFLAKHRGKNDEDSMIKYAISSRDYQIVKFCLENAEV